MHESGENYLETILMIKEKKGVVRSIDVARALNFSKPSVSRAMGLLRDQGFISMEQGGDIQLTEEGLAKAKSIYARHLLLTAFLQEVTGVSEEMAAVWSTFWIRKWSTGSVPTCQKANRAKSMPGMSCPAY